MCVWKEWEAYVSDSDSDAEAGGSWPDALSPEERQRQHRDREESRRVLFELKAVLGFRASEGERMKRKQLLFNDRGLQEGPPPPVLRVGSRSGTNGAAALLLPPCSCCDAVGLR